MWHVQWQCHYSSSQIIIVALINGTTRRYSPLFVPRQCISLFFVTLKLERSAGREADEVRLGFLWPLNCAINMPPNGKWTL